MKKIYALYKGETNLTDGTKQQIANYLKVSLNTIHFYTTPAYKKRCKSDNCYKVIFIGNE